MTGIWTKVCGVGDVATATFAAEAGASAIGLNFYPPSPRFVDAAAAEKIARSLPHTTEAVGVFVNATPDDIVALVDRVGLQRVQFHGDESPEVLATVQQRAPGLALIRAWRMSAGGLQDLAAYLKQCRELDVVLSACLVDAHVTGRYGGTGAVVPWDALRAAYQVADWPPLILAGGLHPGNITAAIDAVQPWGIDVASGVESSPGVKERTLIQQFLEAARAS